MPLLMKQHRRRRFDRSAEQEFVADGDGLVICSVADLDRHGRVVVKLADPAIDLLVMKVAGRLYALNNGCPHAGAPLDSRGVVAGRTITCTAHGRRFDLGSGRCLDQRREQTRPLTTFRAWITDGTVLVAVRYTGAVGLPCGASSSS